MSFKDYRKIARVKLGSNIFTDTWTKLGILCLVVGYIPSVFSFITRNFLDPRLVTILFLILTIFLIPMEYSLNRILLNVSRGNEEIEMSEVTYYYDVPFSGMYKVEILKYVPKESVDKIPQTMLDIFNAKKDNTYNFSIDINKSFEEQELLEETKAILANIFRDYWATPYQKERIQAKERYDMEKIEEEKRAKYDSDIFKSIENTNSKDVINNNNKTVCNFIINIY